MNILREENSTAALHGPFLGLSSYQAIQLKFLHMFPVISHYVSDKPREKCFPTQDAGQVLCG